METLAAVGFALLVVNAGAHVANVLACLRRPAGGGAVDAHARGSAARGAIALLLPPVAATWAWQAGARRRVMVYGASLVAFAAVVVVLTHTR